MEDTIIISELRVDVNGTTAIWSKETTFEEFNMSRGTAYIGNH